MIKEALEYLFNKGEQARRSTRLGRFGSREVFEDASGTRFEMDTYVHRITIAKSLKTISALANKCSAEKAELWFDDTEIVLLEDGSSAEADRHVMEIVASSPWNTLSAGGWYPHKDFVGKLDSQFNIPEELMDAIRTVKFKTASQIQSAVSDSNESMGRSIDRSVESEKGALQKTFSLKLPRWEDFDISVDAKVRLGFDYDGGRMQIAFANQEEWRRSNRAANAALFDLVSEAVKEAGIKVYEGSPNMPILN